jgi:hypothetical protein
MKELNKRVAVCVSGIVRKNSDVCIERINQILPFDTYYGVCINIHNEPLKNLNNVIEMYQPEPEYHPYYVEDRFAPNCPTYHRYRNFKIPDKGNYQRTKLGYLEVLNSYNLINKIPEHYDLIIKCRFDVFISKEINFMKLIQHVIDKEQTIGIANLLKNTDENEPFKFGYNRKEPYQINSDIFLLNFIIIHKRNNIANVHQLIKQKRLLPAEYGYYQAFGQKNNKGILNLHGRTVLAKHKFKN